MEKCRLPKAEERTDDGRMPECPLYDKGNCKAKTEEEREENNCWIL